MAQSPEMLNLSRLPRREIEAMARAGRIVVDCARRLARQDDNVVAPLLSGQGPFYQWNHYPAGDVYDSETHAQYYYHTHPTAETTRTRAGEHGHFHTFLRCQGMPAGLASGDDGEALSHLIAIAVDAGGVPLRLFTTNRWVTGETWYAASDVAAMLPYFAVRRNWPSTLTNRWITALMRLFRPDILTLLRRRDRAFAAWSERHRLSTEAVFEDRRLETLSETMISVPARMAALDAALGKPATSSPRARKR
jgi:hypothetical protein